jgi:hypothetical protein
MDLIQPSLRDFGNSKLFPAFQRRVRWDVAASPEGTSEEKANTSNPLVISALSAVPPGLAGLLSDVPPGLFAMMINENKNRCDWQPTDPTQKESVATPPDFLPKSGAIHRRPES